ncbi:MerR family transcriptional regulator [Dongia soli]|uniref:MerR family transcriptional regulator n=1 Tax=Dongia soli TaxID=600628 RepID=A0ABU5EA43_9PROT|nr:MerR family transcriptional regulator [Dongia soli]MDY0883213.1 MerR family transcriptional regulator [Dongia soli]
MSSAGRVLDQRNTPGDSDAGKRSVARSSKRLEKSADAFRTISEVADELEVPQHVLRFWETKFTQIRPMKRGGGRRYYRPEDVELLRSIRGLLYDQGYTIKGVQKLIREGGLRLSGDSLAVAPGAVEFRAESPEGDQPTAEAAESTGRGSGQGGKGTSGEMMDLPLFRSALDDSQIKEVKSVIEELRELRDRLRRAADA